MPLCYSNFKSFRNKSSRIFLFEQLLFSKVNKLTCKGQVGLGLDGKGWWRANTGCNQLSDAIGNSHGTSIKIEGCPCKLWQPYPRTHLGLFGNQHLEPIWTFPGFKTSTCASMLKRLFSFEKFLNGKMWFTVIN